MKQSVYRMVGIAAVLVMGAPLAWADGVTIGGDLSVLLAPVKASFSLTNLNYTLTSLDPAGGVTPSLTPSSSSVFSVYAVPNIGDYSQSIGSGMLAGDHFDGSSATVSLPGDLASATKQGNSQSADANLTASGVLVGDALAVYSQVKTYSTFTLSAHTQLVITGDLLMSINVDSASISGLLAGSDRSVTVNPEVSFSPYIFALNGTLTSNAMSTDVTPFGAPQYWHWAAGATQSLSATSASDLSVYNDLPGGQFTMQITNDGDSAVDFQLNSIAYAQTSLTAVPELGTWALMGLGLVGVAAASRRKYPV